MSAQAFGRADRDCAKISTADDTGVHARGIGRERGCATTCLPMGYPLKLSLRYMTSKKGASISVGTVFAIVGVALGVAALATVMSVTGGFQAEFRDKVLGVNAHVLVLKYSTDFREYRDVMARVAHVPGVTGVAPFIINPMMVSHDNKTATGVLFKGVDPDLMPSVLDLPRHIHAGSLAGLRRPGARPPDRPGATLPGTVIAHPPKRTAQRIDDAERDDAGRNLTLLRAIEASLEETEHLVAGDRADAGSPAEPDPPAAEIAETPLPSSAPRGAVEPAGGYGSRLPEDDTLPADVAPDPCANAEAVAKLPGIVVGATLARNLGLSLGNCVQVTSPTIGYLFSQGSIRPPVAKQFRLIAIFEAGFDQYDSKLVYSDLFEAQGFYDQGDTVTGVEMKVADIDKARSIAHRIEKMLANGLYHTMDWEELNHGLFTALLIQKIGMSFVLGLIILVAAFTVIATLIMVVLDKKKEIAVLKAMGATDDAILRTFLYQGAIIGLIGTTTGLALGLLVCKGLLVYAFPLDPKVYFISHLPVNVRVADFAITGIVAVAICLTATVVPALYAARLRPADGLRAQ
jgi:lipoprotein-releasing system permease protein